MTRGLIIKTRVLINILREEEKKVDANITRGGIIIKRGGKKTRGLKIFKGKNKGLKIKGYGI
jgi:hypothetical protein